MEGLLICPKFVLPKRNTMKHNRIYWLLVLMFINSCKSHYAPLSQEEIKYHNDSGFVNAPSSGVIYEVLLIGDTGRPAIPLDREKYPDEYPDVVFSSLVNHSKTNNNKGIDNVILLLGDNIYKNGLKRGGIGKNRSKLILQTQVDWLNQTKSDAFFIPGNHDYKFILGSPAHNRMKRQAKYLNEKEDNVFLAPDVVAKEWYQIKTINQKGKEVGLVLFDSQAFLNWGRKSEKERTFESLQKEVMNRSDIQTWILATHHPIFSADEHGEKTGGFAKSQHVNGGKNYKEFATRLKSLIDGMSVEDKQIVVVSGHDHSLQLLKGKNYYQVVSGAGVKVSHEKLNCGKLIFGQQNKGYAVLSIYEQNEIWIQFYGAFTAREGDFLLFSKKLF